jgi:hypothetical protein
MPGTVPPTVPMVCFSDKARPLKCLTTVMLLKNGVMGSPRIVVLVRVC